MSAANLLPLGAMTRMAWRNLWRNHRRTLIMLLAISVGVWAMIFMTALMRGMVDQMIDDGIDSLPGFVQIHHPAFRDDPSVENSLPQPGPLLLAALQDPEVTGWTSRIRVPAMISSERDSRGITLLGVDPKGEVTLGFDPESIVEGRFLQSPEDTGLVIGKKMLDRLETDLGKRVVVMSQDPENNIADRGFRIVGVYEAKLAALEEVYIYAGRSTVQSLLNIDGQVSEIAITGQDYRNVDNLHRLVKDAAGDNAEVRPWTELDTYLGLMLGVMDGFVLVWVIVIFLALSAGFTGGKPVGCFEHIADPGRHRSVGGRRRHGNDGCVEHSLSGAETEGHRDGKRRCDYSGDPHQPAARLAGIAVSPCRSHRKNLKEYPWLKSNVSNCARTTSKVMPSSRRWTMSRSVLNRDRSSACPGRRGRAKPPC
jgi:hypothetical protein